jgi:hypothetical protein
MFSDKRKLGFPYRPILAIFIGLVILCTGCGPSYEERQAQKEAEKKEQTRKKQEEEKGKIADIEARFNAVYFPPQNIGSTSFTYEIQKFFEVHSENNIIFKGYLEDIEAKENNIFVEFVCPIEENYFLTKKAIYFRLAVPESKLGQFLEAKRADPMLSSLRFIYGPDYFVVSKINKTQRIRKYEFDGNANGEEVEIETEVSRGIVALGQLIEAVAIPKKE